jgi:pyruvate/2-oxoglutarate dehydrogenase complex dihydrolipoamide dehydrogenase (E3) component
MRRLAVKSGATIRTGVEATVELVDILEPDVVVLATGAEPATLPIAGLENALTSKEILTGDVDTGSRVLLIGGGMVGIEVAEFLAVRGKEVTVIEILGEVARDMLPVTRKLTLNRLEKLHVEILTETEVERVNSGTVLVSGPDGEREIGPFDSIVAAAGTRSNSEMAEPLMACGLEVHVVGDAADLKQIIGAVQSAWEVACKI